MMTTGTTAFYSTASKTLSAVLSATIAMCGLSGAYADYVVLNSSASDTGFRDATWTPAEYSPSRVDPANYDYIVKSGKKLVTLSDEQIGVRKREP